MNFVTWTTVNPHNGDMLQTYQLHSPNELNVILDRLHHHKPSPLQKRLEQLNQLSNELLTQQNALAKLVTLEMGKPLSQSLAEIQKSAGLCKTLAEQGLKWMTLNPIQNSMYHAELFYERLGTILAVMPWNFPIWQTLRAFAPCALVGNSFLLKPASNTVGCSQFLSDIIQNIFFDSYSMIKVEHESMDSLIADSRINAVTLTGSPKAGRIVASLAGKHLKKVILELGGSDPYVVLKDADIELAAKDCATSRMINAGQSCVAAKRFLVDQSVISEFEQKFCENLSKYKITNPMESDCNLGPLARKDIRDQLHQMVQESTKLGAKLIMGGTLPSGPGNYYLPTVLSHTNSKHPVFAEETFGPVATLTTFETESQAIELANDCKYGLAASVFTSSETRFQNVSRQLNCGMVFWNAFVRSDSYLPFGGVKESGFGRELSSYCIGEFANLKSFVKLH